MVKKIIIVLLILLIFWVCTNRKKLFYRYYSSYFYTYFYGLPLKSGKVIINRLEEFYNNNNRIRRIYINLDLFGIIKNKALNTFIRKKYKG